MLFTLPERLSCFFKLPESLFLYFFQTTFTQFSCQLNFQNEFEEEYGSFCFPGTKEIPVPSGRHMWLRHHFIQNLFRQKLIKTILMLVLHSSMLILKLRALRLHLCGLLRDQKDGVRSVKNPRSILQMRMEDQSEFWVKVSKSYILWWVG